MTPQTKPFPTRRFTDASPLRAPSLPVQPAPVAAASPVKAAAEPEVIQPKKAAAKAKQETLPLEGVSRGRFDKSEPTLYDGEDLDVPTFIRRGVSLKR